MIPTVVVDRDKRHPGLNQATCQQATLPQATSPIGFADLLRARRADRTPLGRRRRAADRRPADGEPTYLEWLATCRNRDALSSDSSKAIRFSRTHGLIANNGTRPSLVSSWRFGSERSTKGSYHTQPSGRVIVDRRQIGKSPAPRYTAAAGCAGRRDAPTCEPIFGCAHPLVFRPVVGGIGLRVAAQDEIGADPVIGLAVVSERIRA